MSIDRLKRLLTNAENIRLEFKEAAAALPGNLFETICAMLNRDGGDVILGADDTGNITGVVPAHLATMVTNLVNLSNNAQKLDPPFILYPQTYEINGQWLIHLQVPASSQVHKTANVIYDRSNDGDYKVTQPHRIAEIYNRKRNHYTESIIYPALRFEHFKADLFPKIRNLIRSNNPNHPWLALDDRQLLVKAGLWRQDLQAAQEGYTLAAALLLGTDEVIQSVVPHYKIDALVRTHNTDRYDDRAYIQTNLIEAYEQLMDFVAKHLPDTFYLEGIQRVSLRNKIFREVAANIIVHREYTNAHPCTFVIYRDRVQTENANNPHGEGPIDPLNFAPFPKNPTLVKFFIQLGRAEELGSGVLNINRLIKAYSGKDAPQFVEGEVFKMIIPLAEGGKGVVVQELDIADEATTNEAKLIADAVNDTVNDTVSDTIKQRLIDIVMLVRQTPGIRKQALIEQLKVTDITLKRDIQRLNELVAFIGPQKTGGYFLTKRLHDKLHDKKA